MRVRLNLTEDQSDDFCRGINGLRISVHGQITHVGVANERSPLMTIGGNLVCGMQAGDFLEYESIRLIPIDPTPKRGFLRRLRNWREGGHPKQERHDGENPN
jgi:hypothetical protein